VTAPGLALIGTDLELSLGGRPVLRGVSLAAEPGQILALVGPNGCGKSTLLSVLAGIRTPAKGSVQIGTEQVADISVRDLARYRSMVTQTNRVDTPFTVREVVELGRYPWTRTSKAVDSERIIDEAVAACEIGELLNRPFPELSGGQQARVSLARALAQDTPVMLLDEPTAALDIGHSEQVLQILRRRAAEGTTIVLVVHDLSLAAAYADRVALMRAGTLLATGTVDEVMTAEALSAVYDHPVMLIRNPDTGELIITPRRD